MLTWTFTQLKSSVVLYVSAINIKRALKALKDRLLLEEMRANDVSCSVNLLPVQEGLASGTHNSSSDPTMRFHYKDNGSAN